MRKLLLLLIFFTLVGCDEDSNSSNALSNSTETQVNNNTSMINMIKAYIKDIKDMLNTVKNQILNIEDEIENNVPPVPVPDMNSTMPKIIDKNSNVVGEYLGPSIGRNEYLTILEINNIKHVLLVRTEGLTGNAVFFANNDCTGQAYVSAGSNEMVMPVGVAPLNANMDPDNETLYEVDVNNIVNATFDSVWNFSDHICEVTTDTRDLFTANAIFDLSVLFLPPYTLDIN